MHRTLQLGATGYQLKGTWSDETIKAFRKAREDTSPLRDRTAQRIHSLLTSASGRKINIGRRKGR
jgi:DNA-binding NarL/FixJ family response regulator